MDLSDRIKRVEFLGAEFITWLWFREVTRGGSFELGGELGEVEVAFSDKLVMGSTAFDEQEDSFKGGRPSMSLEAQIALRLGKLAQQAKISVTQGDQEWLLVLRSAPLMMSAIKLPEVNAQGGQGQLQERMFLLEHIERLYRGLYKLFLEERLSERWNDEVLPEMRAWIGPEPDEGELDDTES